MKILFVSNLSWNLFNFRLGLMSALKEKGHKVLFCAPYDKYTEELIKRGFDFIPVKFDRKGTSPLDDLLLFFGFYRIYNSQKPDFILHFTIKPNIYGSFAARLSGIKCINTVSGLGYIFISKNHFFNLVKLLYRMACNLSEKTFFHNEEDARCFTKNRIIRKEKSVVVKGSGVNVDYFKPDYSRCKSKNNAFTFLYLGRLLWDKGILELVEATGVVKKNYPDIKLCLAGAVDNGNPSAIPFSKIQEWEKAKFVEYLGELADVRNVLSESDCVVLPSYKEGAPKALLEALAMEKAVIATDVPGCTQIVEDGINGFIVPVKDSRKLAIAMQRIIELPQEKRRQMGLSGREKILKEFDEKLVIEKYINELAP